MKFNPKRTVINIFWKLKNPSKNEKENDEAIKSLENYLKKAAPYISGKMTQLFGFRYGPDIRFHYDKILPITEKKKEDIKKHQEGIIDYDI